MQTELAWIIQENAGWQTLKYNVKVYTNNAKQPLYNVIAYTPRACSIKACFAL